MSSKRGASSESRRIILAIVAASGTLLGGCSSSTEPKPTPPQGFAVHITTSPSAAVAGDTVRATFTIENVTSGTLTRTIGYLYYPRAFVADGSDGLRDLLIFGSGAPSTAITLGPHESVSGVSTFLAYRAGIGELTGCLPLDAITLDVPVCADATVAIKEH